MLSRFYFHDVHIYSHRLVVAMHGRGGGRHQPRITVRRRAQHSLCETTQHGIFKTKHSCGKIKDLEDNSSCTYYSEKLAYVVPFSHTFRKSQLLPAPALDSSFVSAVQEVLRMSQKTYDSLYLAWLNDMVVARQLRWGTKQKSFGEAIGDAWECIAWGNEEGSVRSAEPGEDGSGHGQGRAFTCRWREQCPTPSPGEDSSSTPLIC